jgi:hypothetical protein
MKTLIAAFLGLGLLAGVASAAPLSAEVVAYCPYGGR